jgi:uncharacterized protein (DUF1501 family)
MLTLFSDRRARDCEGTTRRDFLQVGLLGLGSLTLPGLLAARAQAATAGSTVKDTSVVLLFCSGGASHIETFDPKMQAPAEYRSVTGEVQTSIPGVTFGGTFPRLARLAHEMAVVRSFQHAISDHAKAIDHVLTAGNPTGAGMGAIFARLRGTNHPRNGLPTYVQLTADEVDPQNLKEKDRVIKSSGPGTLGSAYFPFDPSGNGQANQNMQLRITRDRLGDRRALLKTFDAVNRQIDASGVMEGLDKFEQQAFELILGNAASAFDLRKEDPRLLAKYDTSAYQVGHKRSRPCPLGHQLLLARRLCEAGCGFVTVHSAGWDMHADVNNPGMVKGMDILGRPLDHALAAFLEDVAERGLSDKILLVLTGDFGRTPKVNARGGRDHWPSLCTLAFAGGGLKMGQVVGLSAPRADVPNSTPVTLDHLLGTILHVLFNVPALRLRVDVPRAVAQILERNQPIPQLV